MSRRLQQHIDRLLFFPFPTKAQSFGVGPGNGQLFGGVRFLHRGIFTEYGTAA